MAAAGARAGESARTASGGRAEYTIKRLGPLPPRRTRRTLAVAAAIAVVAAGGGALASLTLPGRPAGHPAGHPGFAGPSVAPVRSRPASAPPSPVRRPAPAAPAPAHPGRGPAAPPDVVGVGCPNRGGDTVTFDNAPTGPGWMPAGGGWTGDGCDGSTVWTMDPNGRQPVPSTLTWTFRPSGASRCTLAVFVPSMNALGVSDYSVSVGPPAASRVIAAVPVSQSALAGNWLTLGSFTVSGSSLEITTAPLPGASGHGHHGAVAASAARAVCTP